MKKQEFRRQVFKTAAQWRSGLFQGLEVLEDGGCTLPYVPAVSAKIESIAGIASPVAIAADCCGILYVLDTVTKHVYKYVPATDLSERIPCPEYLDKPWRAVLSGTRLWTVDAARGEIRACSLTHSQVVTAIALLEEPVDIAVNGAGELYALDGKTKRIYRFDRHGSLISCFGEPNLKEPVSIAVGKDDVIYVVDGGYGRLLRFSRGGEYQGGGSGLGTMGRPVIIIGDAEAGGFLLNDSGEMYRFDEAGIASGTIRFPEDAGPVIWISSDGCGRLYASTSNGIYLLVSGKAFSTGPGYYYSKTLDSGAIENRWHRLVMEAHIPSDTVVDLYSYTSDDETLRDRVDGAVTDPAKTTLERAAFIDSVIPWNGPEENGTDMLFKVNAGRFLWIKLALKTFDEKERPVVRAMKVYTPRISYLRYLPAIYQEDAVSKDFLERFLSLFESLYFALEVEISEITRYFGPKITPPEFLKWLSSWVNMAIEEDWDVETKRKFIREAARLYTMKGTVAGIRRFVEIYTGKIPAILEHALAGNPVVLGGQFRLGINTMLVKTPVRGFRLGDDSIVGRSALRHVEYSAEDPFLTEAFRFTVLIDLTQDERDRYEKGLKAIIADGKPAHTSYAFRIASGASAGANSYVGISTFVGGYDPLCIGSSKVGSGLLLAEGDEGGRVEERSVIGKDTKLI